MEDAICHTLHKHYKKTVLNIKQLVGYEDSNFVIDTVDINSDSSIFGHESGKSETFIVKITSCIPGHYLDIQFKLMEHLFESGISTCKPICGVDGHYKRPWPKAGLSSFAYMLSYIPGVTLLEAGNPIFLLEDVGRLVGRIDRCLQTFKGDTLPGMNTLSEMSRVQELELLIREHCSEDVIELGVKIIQAYTSTILPAIGKLQTGYIHGDINNCNIIVQPLLEDNYVISGIIDYGDACSSYYVYELVITMADLMSSCLGKHEPLTVAKLILKGYLQEMQLNEYELRFLKRLLCVRLMQLYVLSGETLREQPDNAYAGIEREENLDVCKYVWELDEELFHQQVLLNL